MTKEQLCGIFGMCKEHGIKSKAFTMDTCYTDDEVLLKGGINLIVVKYTKPMHYQVEYKKVDDMFSIADKPIVKCVIVDNNVEYVEQIRDRINADIEGVTAVKSNWNCIDIIRSDVSKGAALIDYAHSEGIDASEIVAFGDSENDISMLKMAGLGIAVDNAEANVKAAADRVTLTNDECGVAVALEELFKDILE
jgi:hypothetical protein